MKRLQTPVRILAILRVIFCAWRVRSRAPSTLPIGCDESDHLRAGQGYAHLIRTSNGLCFLETNCRPEHPPLAKIIIGLSILSATNKPLTPDAASSADPNNFMPPVLVKPAHPVNAIRGTVTAAILALINPRAGSFLAVHTFTINFFSQGMLEAFPTLISLTMALSDLQWKQAKRSKLNGWPLLCTATITMSINAFLIRGSTQPWNQIGSLAILMSADLIVIFLIVQRTPLERMIFGNAK
jgi:hypothetical protein